MNIGALLQRGTQTLSAAGIATARLDVLVLLEDELGVPRPQLLAHPEQVPSKSQIAKLHTKITQRADHTPLAYIRGKAAFFGRSFVVNEHVLVPRPESETIISVLKKLRVSMPKIADIGTGSGCLGITAALEIAKSEVWLFDVSKPALDVARQNAAALGARVHAAVGNLAEPCTEQHFDVVLANLPYVPDHFPINRAAQHEPKLALFAGADGLDAYRAFWQQLAAVPKSPAFVLCESLPFQQHAIAVLARRAGFVLKQTEDFIQLFTQ